MPLMYNRSATIIVCAGENPRLLEAQLSKPTNGVELCVYTYICPVLQYSY
jgi:hypothetical protein